MTVKRLANTDRHQWLHWRKQDITGSDLGALAGVDAWRTPYEIWAQKAELASPPEMNAAMKLGVWCEPAVPCALLDEHPGRFTINYPLGLYVSDPDLRLGGTPDATGTDGGEPCVFEFKVISKQSFERSWTEADAPPSYVLQTLANAMLLDVPKGILAALVLGFQSAELVVREIPRHAGAEAAIRRLVSNFWTAFDEGHAPDPDFSRDAAVIRQVFRPDPDKPAPIDLSSDNKLADMLDHREQLKTISKAGKVADEETRAIDAEIILKMAGATEAIAGPYRLTWREEHRKAYSVKESTRDVLKVTQPAAKEEAA